MTTAAPTGRYAGLHLGATMAVISTDIRRVAADPGILRTMDSSMILDTLRVLQRRLWSVSPGLIETISEMIGAIDHCPGDTHTIIVETIVGRAAQTWVTITPQSLPE